MTKPWGRHYIAAVILTGFALLGVALWNVATTQIDPSWLFLALLTLAAGFFPVSIPGVPALIYILEAFVFTIVLIYGVSPAVVAFTLAGLVVTFRRTKREPFRIAFNMAEPAISMTVAGQAVRWAGVGSAVPVSLDALVFPLVGMATIYFLLNSWLNAFAVSAETGAPATRIWRQHLLIASVNCFAGASVALILANLPHFGPRVVAAVVPLLAVVYLAFRAAMGRVADSHAHLRELNELYLSTIETLAMAIDAKDQVTHGHIRRVQRLAVALARRLGIEDPKHLQAIEAAALLHDIGKIAVPESILNKAGKLTTAETERMRQHAAIGAQMLSPIRFPHPVAPIVRHHHENWDGSGYPDGLAGTEIPLDARIMSVVDCYDALTSDRPYRAALPADEALGILVSQKGIMYDPMVVDAFLLVQAQWAGTPDTRDTSAVHALVRQPGPEPPRVSRAGHAPTSSAAVSGEPSAE